VAPQNPVDQAGQSAFAPRKHASFAERKATLLLEGLAYDKQDSAVPLSGSPMTGSPRFGVCHFITLKTDTE